jgi:hypothetical protein
VPLLPADNPPRTSSFVCQNLFFQALSSASQMSEIWIFQGSGAGEQRLSRNKIAERHDAESLLGSCVWSILEGEIAENGSAGQCSAKTIHSESNQQ